MLVGPVAWPIAGGLTCLLAVLLVIGWEDVVLHLRVGVRRILTSDKPPR